MDLTTLSLEDLMKIPVHGASKFDQKTSDPPASITIVTADDIQKFGYRTLADFLPQGITTAVFWFRSTAIVSMKTSIIRPSSAQK